jgi:hypothetical protein
MKGQYRILQTYPINDLYLICFQVYVNIFFGVLTSTGHKLLLYFKKPKKMIYSQRKRHVLRQILNKIYTIQCAIKFYTSFVNTYFAYRFVFRY